MLGPAGAPWLIAATLTVGEASVATVTFFQLRQLSIQNGVDETTEVVAAWSWAAFGAQKFVFILVYVTKHSTFIPTVRDVGFMVKFL